MDPDSDPQHWREGWWVGKITTTKSLVFVNVFISYIELTIEHRLLFLIGFILSIRHLHAIHRQCGIYFLTKTVVNK